MHSEDRHIRILETLEKEGDVRVAELASILAVEPELIRRDLGELEGAMKLRRTQGGATKIKAEDMELSHAERAIQNIPRKKAIAKTACSLLESCELIFMDASSTVLQMALALPDIPLTVITHSHLIVAALNGREDVKIVMLGGNYDHASNSFLGPTTTASLDRYRIDKVFCSGNGIEVDHGISEINEWQASAKERAIERAGQTCYLADSSKLGVLSTYIFAQTNQIDLLITNPDADKGQLDKLKAVGLNIIFSE